MSTVVRSGDKVKRTPTPASKTIQQFLTHLRQAGIDWVPEPLGFDDTGREVLSFIPGEAIDGVPPSWFWNETVLVDVAKRLRQLHDASRSFKAPNIVWNWESISPEEVILHRDFAPYNCVFREERFAGLIDFDLCAPGPRIWDIAYTAYRFVPLMPLNSDRNNELWSDSPFDLGTMITRLEVFSDAYNSGGQQLSFCASDVLAMAIQRLDAMVEWIKAHQRNHSTTDLAENEKTYTTHRLWLATVLQGRV